MNSLFRFLKFAIPTAMIGFTLFFVPAKLMDKRGIERVNRLNRELLELNETNRQLIRENESLKSEIRAFNSDPEYIEKVARDELGMIRKNELIYQFSDQGK